MKLTRQQRAVFEILTRHATPGKRQVAIKAAQIAAELNTTSTAIYRTLRALRGAGVIADIGTRNRVTLYSIASSSAKAAESPTRPDESGPQSSR